MQTPKTRQRSFEVPQKRSQHAVSSEQSQKISPQSRSYEKKHPSKVTKLKSQVSELQKNLKKVKDKISSTEAAKVQAGQHVFAAMSSVLGDNGESLAHQAQPRVNETLLQLEAAKKTVETLRSDDIEELKATLMHKETELEKISEENKMLMLELKEKERNKGNVNQELERAKAAEQQALVKLGFMKEEVEKSNRLAERVAEQLDVARAMNAELEAELRRLRIHSHQWRKAAEAATAMLSAGNGIFMDRTLSMHSHPFSECIDEDFLKRKNANMLKRIGILWKKAPPK